MPDKIVYTGLLVFFRLLHIFFFLLFYFLTANYVDGSSFELFHKIAINVAFLHE